MVVAIAAAILGSLAIQKPDLAILIYWQPGMGPHRVPATLEAAIWTDGKIVWRDPAPLWAKRHGEWGLQAGTYRQGHANPKAIAQALLRLKDKSKSVIQHWGSSIPDSHCTRIQLAHGTWRQALSCTGEPRETAPYGWEKQWNPGLALWKSVRVEVKALIPRLCKIIPKPSDSQWKLRPGGY
ncbi:MAG: hypothetical protein H7Y17_09230 [Chlorobia bacterium]|nr:hypothetical protein [Fimbriimonadaceae bacterium]